MACYYPPQARASHPQKLRAYVPAPACPCLLCCMCLSEDAWARRREGVSGMAAVRSRRVP